MIRACSFAILMFLAATPLAADGLRLRLEYNTSGAFSAANSLDTFLGFQNRTNGAASARLMWDKSSGPFRVEIASQISASQGNSVAYSTAFAPFYPTPLPSTLFNLATTWQSNTTTLVTNNIDRLSISYSATNFVVKLGRQAVTWGSGTVFHPSDIVAAFAPNAIDTSYKPGVDMIYAQYLLDNGADIQAIAVPRAATLGGPVDFASSTYAMRGQTQLGSLDGAMMFGRDRGDSVLSFGLSGALGGAGWNAEYVYWTLVDGTSHPTWLFNIANFGTIGDFNISYFAEYYHNGFGVDASVNLASLPASLTKRMSTGQVFFAGTDFLALGAALQLTADLSFAPNAIISLNDGSALAGFAVSYALSDNANLAFNLSQPLGPEGSEFGGRETTGGSGIYATGAGSATLQLVYFF